MGGIELIILPLVPSIYYCIQGQGRRNNRIGYPWHTASWPGQYSYRHKQGRIFHNVRSFLLPIFAPTVALSCATIKRTINIVTLCKHINNSGYYIFRHPYTIRASRFDHFSTSFLIYSTASRGERKRVLLS